MRRPRVALVTGASSGIGYATAIRLKEAGFNVYACARRIDKMLPLQEMGIKTFKMDVSDDVSMVEGINDLIQKEGRIDILVNNAGYGSCGALEDVPIDEARYQFEVNVFGLARLTQLVLPYMRKQHYGKIVNVSSVGGKVYIPLIGWYHATKHAVEGLSDSLRLEVKQFGIDVIVIQPAGTESEWRDIAIENLMGVSGNTVYGELATKVSNAFYGNRQSTSDDIALSILKSVTTKKPKLRYVPGIEAKAVLFARKNLTDKAFDTIIIKMINKSNKNI